MINAEAWMQVKAILGELEGIQFAWPNRTFEPIAERAFVRVGMRSSGGEPAEVGRYGVWAERGAVEFHVCTPKGFGTEEARQVIDRVAAAFRTSDSAPLYWSGYYTEEGENADGADYWILHLTIDFRTQSLVTS
jgi:hypothetical protein